MNINILRIDVDLTACKVRNDGRFVRELCTLYSANTVGLSMLRTRFISSLFPSLSSELNEFMQMPIVH